MQNIQKYIEIDLPHCIKARKKLRMEIYIYIVFIYHPNIFSECTKYISYRIFIRPSLYRIFNWNNARKNLKNAEKSHIGDTESLDRCG